MYLISRIRVCINRHRNYSSILTPDSTTILTPDSTTILTTKEITRAAISILKSETDPTKILDICRAASLSPDYHLDRVALSLAITSLRKSQSFSAITTLLEEFKHRPDLRTERFLSHSMVLYGQAGMIDNAIKTFNEMKQFAITPTTKSLNSLIFACVVAKEYDQVNRIFTDFPKMYAIVPNLDTYNNVIRAFCESGMATRSYSVLSEIERKGYKATTTTFWRMLAGFYAEEKFQDVQKVLEMMQECGKRPGLSTTNIRIQSLCKLGKSNEAKALLEGMLARNVKPNAVTYHHLIHGFGKEGNAEEMKRLFNDMRKMGCVPDSTCYYTFIHFLCECGDFETALKVCKYSMSNEWHPPFGSMKNLVRGLASISKFEEAQELVAKMKERFTNHADMWREVEEGLPQ